VGGTCCRPVLYRHLPGNINQYVEGIDAFGLDTDQARFTRLFFQPVLVVWALWSTGAIRYVREILRARNT
jgi:hypothetical protein